MALIDKTAPAMIPIHRLNCERAMTPNALMIRMRQRSSRPSRTSSGCFRKSHSRGSGKHAVIAKCPDGIEDPHDSRYSEHDRREHDPAFTPLFHGPTSSLVSTVE